MCFLSSSALHTFLLRESCRTAGLELGEKDLNRLAARKALLAKEKKFTQERDALAAERRRLPMVKVERQYVFDTLRGKQTLADLFAGCSQLVVYHFMFGPDWKEGCPSCSMAADHFDGAAIHLARRDVTLLVISRAPLAPIEAFKKRMGWHFHWVSSNANDFNRDYHVTSCAKVKYTTSIRVRKRPVSAPSTRIPTAKSSIPTRHTGAVSKTCLAFTRSSIPFLRAATKAPWLIQWPGCATTTNIRTLNHKRPCHVPGRPRERVFFS